MIGTIKSASLRKRFFWGFLLDVHDGSDHITAVHLNASHCSVELNKERVYVEAIAGEVVVNSA
jgi:hypothetical protein